MESEKQNKLKLGSLFSGIGGFEYCAQLYNCGCS
jgi:site-specific DNA-cytosine methylase